MEQVELIATCTFGLEGILKEEVKKLGFKDIETSNGRVKYKGDLGAIVVSNLWLRTADRVLLKIGSFKAVTFDELFEKTKACQWEKWISKDGKFPVVKATSVKSTLFSKSDCQSIVKKAIVERLKKSYRVNWFEESGEYYPIHVNILKDQVILSIDTSGVGLHKRGYRALGNQAPLKETLAAAMVYISRWEANRMLADPLCGSGTILIEAALLGRNIAPGLNRSFNSELWSDELRELYREARERAHLEKRDLDITLFGADIDEKSIALAKKNASIAGVSKNIYFKTQDVSDFNSDESFGVIITNPPYGDRLSSKREVEKLYRNMGKAFAKLDNWSYFILSGHLDFEKYFGKAATKNRKLYNGNILTYLYQYFGKLPSRGRRGLQHRTGNYK